MTKLPSQSQGPQSSHGSAGSKQQAQVPQADARGPVPDVDNLKDFDFDSFLHTHEKSEILQDFDTDSFLHRDGDTLNARNEPNDGPLGSSFPFKPYSYVSIHAIVATDDGSWKCITTRAPDADTEPTPPVTMDELIGSNFSSTLEVEPSEYVNRKQSHRILKRRGARQALEERFSSTRSHLVRPTAEIVNESGQGKEVGCAAQGYNFGAGNKSTLRGQAQQAGAFPSRQSSPTLNHKRNVDSTNISMEPGQHPQNGNFLDDDVIHAQPKPLVHSAVNIAASLTRNPLLRPRSRQVISDLSHPLSGLYPCLKLSPSQDEKLWWRSFSSTRLLNFQAFQVLFFELANELGLLDGDAVCDDEILCNRVSTNMKSMGMVKHADELRSNGLEKILDVRANVIRIVSIVDEQTGLRIATLGWSCVFVFLAASLAFFLLAGSGLSDIVQIYEGTFSAEYKLTPITIATLNKSFSQLQDLVAIIARYAVMDDLYQHSDSSLSLKHEYRSGLLSLSSMVLEYFASAFTLGRSSMKPDEAVEDKDALIESCDKLMKSIKEKDIACQALRFVVETKESESEGESEAEVDDVSDDSWEEIHVPTMVSLILASLRFDFFYIYGVSRTPLWSCW